MKSLTQQINCKSVSIRKILIFLNVYECRYLWFFMECILARGDNYNFTKKLAENIKHTKDANAEETDSTNHVCKFYS